MNLPTRSNTASSCPPAFPPVLAVERIRGSDNNHVELMQQGNALSAMSRRVVEMIVAYPGGPPLVAIPDVAKVKAQSAGTGPAGIDILRVCL